SRFDQDTIVRRQTLLHDRELRLERALQLFVGTLELILHPFSDRPQSRADGVFEYVPVPVEVLLNPVIDRTPEPALQMLVEAPIHRGVPGVPVGWSLLFLRFARLARFHQFAFLFLELARFSLGRILTPPRIRAIELGAYFANMIESFTHFSHL